MCGQLFSEGGLCLAINSSFDIWSSEVSTVFIVSMVAAVLVVSNAARLRAT